jgi:competence protein ComGC
MNRNRAQAVHADLWLCRLYSRLKMAWIRTNSGRIALGAIGVALFVVAIMTRKQQAFASTLAVLGLGSILSAVALPRLTELAVGTKGFRATLGHVQEQVEDVVKDVDKLKIRTALAQLIEDGDRAASNLRLAAEMVREDLRNGRPPNYDRGVFDPLALWADNVLDYLRSTPGIGEADAILWGTQGQGDPIPLKIPDRFDGEIRLIRERQDRLRDLIKRFE